MIQEDTTFWVQLISSIKMEFPAFEWVRMNRKLNVSAAREQWGLLQLKCSMGRMECYKRDVYHVGKHSRPDTSSRSHYFLVYT